MKTAQKDLLCIDLTQIDKNDIAIVGGKGANLGEIANSGFPVPPGFAVTVKSYDEFILHNDFKTKILDMLKNLDVSDPSALGTASNKIQKLIETGEIPLEVKREVFKSYKKISGRLSKALVAARSSATAEDLPGMSFAGQQATYLNIKGESNLLQAIKDCWASLFTPRAIFYRTENKISHEKVKISVIVQKMIQSEVSGVMFSIDPVTNDKDRIIIEAVWGLGEMIVQGSVVPDRYLVQKDTFSILSKEISEQKIYLTKRGSETKEYPVPKVFLNVQKITDKEIIELAKLADKLQKHYFFPQDIEWAREKGKLYIVQTRPVTTIGKYKKSKKLDDNLVSTDSPILTGSPASPGIGSGEVKILKSAKEIAKVNIGDVLVAPMTSPDFVPAMKKAVAIVTDEGGQTSHAAIVSRELGIPCIVGTGTATKTLKDGDTVSVDGEKGQVFLGVKVIKEIKGTKAVTHRNINTNTKIYVNLAEPERAKEISKLHVDGVGLLRAEFMIANIGIHPKEAIKTKKQEKFIDKLTHDITEFCKNFYPRPVIYRATDFKTNEYRMLDGGKTWEPIEPNPMLGFRGAFRYIASPEVFSLELKALKRVQEKYDNINIMIPFVRSPEELAKSRRLVTAEGLFDNPHFKFLMMVELPVNVISLEDFIAVGIDGVSIGSNDLTMLITGTDRDNSTVSSAFNERSKSVLWALRRTIRICNKHHITSSICGQAPSMYDDLVAKLVKYGITSMSINPDAIYRVREVVSFFEKELISK